LHKEIAKRIVVKERISPLQPYSPVEDEMIIKNDTLHVR